MNITFLESISFQLQLVYLLPMAIKASKHMSFRPRLPPGHLGFKYRCPPDDAGPKTQNLIQSIQQSLLRNKAITQKCLTNHHLSVGQAVAGQVQ